MIELLAQNATTGIAIGGSGLGVSLIIALLVRRSINKVLDHTENRALHLNPDNGYVKRGECEIRTEAFSKELTDHTRMAEEVRRETRQDIKSIHKRIDDQGGKQIKLLEHIVKKLS